MNGGYLMVSKNDTNLYEKLNKALTLGKPVLWYEDENTCYYIDSITKSGTDIILTKGGKTITIESDGDVTENGSASAPTMENIVDLNGNKRFVEFEGVAGTITGVTFTYNKASLSGTHLMFVLAGNVEDTTTLTNLLELTTFILPDYIFDKIYPLWATNFVEDKTFPLTADDWLTQDLRVVLHKGVNNEIKIIKVNDLTLTADRSFRIQFDLLIDNE